MRRCILIALFSFTWSCLVSEPEVSAQVTWIGGTSSDAADSMNWDLASVPDGTSNVVFRGGANETANVDGDVTWNQIVFNSAGPTTINGFGTVSLNGSAVPHAIFSGGGPHANPSTINPNISTTGVIQGNGEHDLEFNGTVAARKIEAFNSNLIFNNAVTFTGVNNDAFLTGNGSAVFDSSFHWPNAGAGSEFGIESLDVTFNQFLSSDFDPLGLFIINMFDGAVVRNGNFNVFGTQTDLWSRRGDNTYDMNGFDENMEFIGTNAEVVFAIDFGDNDGFNTLIWQASHNMNGSYAVKNFEIGIDVLQLGAAGLQFFSAEQLGKITINGIPYSEIDPGNGNAYWNRDEFLNAQFFNVPEGLVGDYNDDGTVDAADYTVWRDNLGTNTPLPNDLTPNEAVSEGDYDVWKANFGNSVVLGGAAGNSGAVPEPSAIALGAMAALACFTAGRKRRPNRSTEAGVRVRRA